MGRRPRAAAGPRTPVTVRVRRRAGRRDRVAGRRQRRRRHDGRADLPGDFGPGEAKRFVDRERERPAAPPKRRVYAVHTDPRDDVAWESDRIAFRIYGQGLWKVDSLNSSGVDIWVKRMRDPIVDKWYAKGHDEYHHDNGEGADFFDVGETLAPAARASGATANSIARTTSRGWRVIAHGPVRAIFELQYQPWDAGGLRVSETKRIAIDAGHNLNHVVEHFQTEGGAGGDIPWVTGIVKRASVVGSESKAKPWAWLSEWGPVVPKDGGHGELGIGSPVAARRGRGLEGDERALHRRVAREGPASR